MVISMLESISGSSPLSNWTELDIWMYLQQEEVPLPPLYFAHKRKVVKRDGVYLADTPFISLGSNENFEEKMVRFRTIGDATCTGAVLSEADTIPLIIDEVASTRTTERGGRADDKRSDSAMEDRKKQGYF